jgi:hypothetical protein
MRRVIALWSTVGAVWLLTAAGVVEQASGQGAPEKKSSPPASSAPAATTTSAPVPATTSAPAAGAPPAAAPAATGTTPAAAGTTTPGATTNTAEKAEVDAATYAVRLRDLEQRINELKEQIFRSKARLSLLAETVLQGVVAGAQTTIVHENKMSGSYKLVKAVYALDGAPIFNRADEEGGLSEKTEFDVYNGSIVPGEHTLTVNLEYRGHGYGIFSYLKGYRFKVRSSYSFSAPEGKAVNVRVVAYEKGGPTAPLEERPAVRYQEKIIESGSPEPLAAGADAAATTTTTGTSVGVTGTTGAQGGK